MVDVRVLMTMLGKIFSESVWQVSLCEPGGVRMAEELL